MRLLPAVISFVFFLYHRTKPPQRSVLFINLLGTRLTPRASMGDEAPSDGLLRSGVRPTKFECASIDGTRTLGKHKLSFDSRGIIHDQTRKFSLSCWHPFLSIKRLDTGGPFYRSRSIIFLVQTGRNIHRRTVSCPCPNRSSFSVVQKRLLFSVFLSCRR